MSGLRCNCAMRLDEWEDEWPSDPASPTVYPSDNEPEPALYGPDGEVLRWRQRPIGFRRLDDEIA